MHNPPPKKKTYLGVTYKLITVSSLPGTMQPGVLGRAPAGFCSIPGVQPFREQCLPAAAAQPQPHRPAEGAGGLRPVEDSPE